MDIGHSIGCRITMSKKTNKCPAGSPPVLTGKAAYIAQLQDGKEVTFGESGNSMHPRIKHRQKCTYAPVRSASDVRVGDAVFCKVGPSYFTHLISAIRGDAVKGFEFQISNNRGHVNGWTPLDKIFGKVIKVHD